MATAKRPVDNGVNVEALLGAREALTEMPEGAKFQWRATCKWVHGTFSQTSIEKYFGLGEEQKHKREFSYPEHGLKPQVLAHGLMYELLEDTSSPLVGSVRPYR